MSFRVNITKQNMVFVLKVHKKVEGKQAIFIFNSLRQSVGSSVAVKTVGEVGCYVL